MRCRIECLNRSLDKRRGVRWQIAGEAPRSCNRGSSLDQRRAEAHSDRQMVEALEQAPALVLMLRDLLVAQLIAKQLEALVVW